MSLFSLPIIIDFIDIINPFYNLRQNMFIQNAGPYCKIQVIKRVTLCFMGYNADFWV